MKYRCGFIEANKHILSEKNWNKDKNNKGNGPPKKVDANDYLSLPSWFWLLKNDIEQND